MIKKLILHILLSLIKLYKNLISPLLPNSCRFYPSCSTYSKEALIEHGVFKGLWLTFKRIVRCHPFCSAGYDPVVKETAE